MDLMNFLKQGEDLGRYTGSQYIGHIEVMIALVECGTRCCIRLL